MRPIVFRDRLLYATKQTFDRPHRELSSTANKLIGFDGATAAIIFDRELLDFFADDQQLLVLESDGIIWRTTDLERWTRVVACTGMHARSLAVLEA